jgi:hypothetical protein
VRRFDVEAEVRGRLDLVLEDGFDSGQMHDPTMLGDHGWVAISARRGAM